MILFLSRATRPRQTRRAHGHDQTCGEAQAGQGESRKAAGSGFGETHNAEAHDVRALKNSRCAQWVEAAFGAASCILGQRMTSAPTELGSPRPPAQAARATAVAHCWVREIVYQELKFQAERRREHPDAFAARLLTAALVLGVADDLVEKAEVELQIR